MNKFKNPVEQANNLQKSYRVYDHVGDKKPSAVFSNDKEATDYIHNNTGSGEIRVTTPDKLKMLEFEKMKDDELLDHFIKSSGWGFSGTNKNGKFSFNGPDWDKSWNPMTREDVIAELNERKRLAQEEDDDWFDYL